jgi:hypothetical protein
MHKFKCIHEASFYDTDFGMVCKKNKADLNNAYEHLQFTTKDGKSQCFIREWFKDPKIRKYQFVKCLPPPLDCDANTYNLWDGFAIENTKVTEREDDETDFQCILAHILLLCDNDPKVAHFVELWLSSMIQFPAQKNNIALLFKTQQGIGKDLFYLILEKMIGSAYCGNTSRPERDIFGDFNSLLHNKILMVINELEGKVGFKYADKIKNLITNTKEPIRLMRTDVKADELSFTHYMSL